MSDNLSVDLTKTEKKKLKAVLVNLDPSVYAKLREKAAEDKTNATALTRKLITDFLSK
jgi:hypothetical protein